MSILSRIFTVFEVELRRSLTLARMLWWLMLAMFPVVLISLVSIVGRDIPLEVWGGFLFTLIPLLISMLGTFLWTAPAIASELERQSWVYLAVRPHGRMAVLLGKYFAAVVWVVPATIVSVTLSVGVLRLSQGDVASSADAFKLWYAISRLSLLSVPAYAAVFLALGTVFTKRAMVVCVAYVLIFELIVSFVPALINKFTIQYRLRALFLHWVGIDVSQFPDDVPIDLSGSASPWQHVALLATYVIVMLFLGVVLIRDREYTVSTAADVS